MDEPRKKYLSATQINMFLHYPKQFETRYIQGIKTPPTGAMIQSQIWHRTLEENYRQKISTGKDFPLSQMLELYAGYFDHIFKNEEISLKPGENAAKLKDQGLAITKAHHETIAPIVFPAKVEERFEVSLGADFPYCLVGIWDLIDTEGCIVDNKAFGRLPTQEEVDDNVQLSVYSLAYRLVNDRVEKGLRFDVVVKGKEPRPIQIHTKRTNDHCRWLLGVMERMADILESGRFETHQTANYPLRRS
ncbi:MAG: PD-(D/E)XK nuclease family protein [Elusimicrobia bacterium]|nr:PD-(D/E)XK nuclease family protein [Elusimicrobiota bacterium]